MCRALNFLYVHNLGITVRGKYHYTESETTLVIRYRRQMVCVVQP